MRKVIFGINVSLDGCCDHTKFNPDQDVHDYFARVMREAGVLVYGRKTYELMVPFWSDIANNPTNETKRLDNFALAFNSVPQIIGFSRTLDRVDGATAKLVRAKPQDEIRRLKQSPGKNIVTGGVDFPSQLLKLELIDEIRLVVHPVVVGQGRRLFDEMNLVNNFEFNLVNSERFKSGGVALQYVKRRSLAE